MKCAFCEIVAVSEKDRIILENDLAYAFPTNIPVVPGHLLIVPKRCVANFGDLTREERDAIFDLRTKLSVALKKVFAAEGFNYAWNEGELAGQAVFHLHFHMLPRKEGDAGITEYEPRKFLYRPGSRAESPAAELLEVVEMIKKEI